MSSRHCKPRQRAGQIRVRRATSLTALFFEMFQTGVDYFLDPMQLGAPEVAHIVEALIHGVQAAIDSLKPGLEFPIESIDLCPEFPIESIDLCLEFPIESIDLCLELPIEPIDFGVDISIQ